MANLLQFPDRRSWAEFESELRSELLGAPEPELSEVLTVIREVFDQYEFALPGFSLEGIDLSGEQIAVIHNAIEEQIVRPIEEKGKALIIALAIEKAKAYRKKGSE